MSDHIDYARTKQLDQATSNHFNKPGALAEHSLANMQIFILVKMKTYGTQYRKKSRKKREKILIRLFNTLYCGINKQP